MLIETNFSIKFFANIFKDEKQLDDMNLDELDELEDSEDEAILLEYRNKRIAELKSLAEKSKFSFVNVLCKFDSICSLIPVFFL